MTDYIEMKDFTFDSRDEFSRKPIAEKILKLLDSAIEVSPLIIDGKWGTGKTEFCFKLKNLIEADESNDYKVGYINAFQADHTNEPLLTLIAEVASFYGEHDKKRTNFIKNAIPYLRLVSGIGIKALASLAFGKYGAEIPDEFSEGIDEVKDGTESLIDKSLESMIKDQVEAEKNLSSLRKALTEIASTTPIILLIDELDRCRPDFAIMMLETIKHVFDVKNVQIILVTNAEQLKATIKHSYGSETDSHNYFYKFFKYQIKLPTSIKDIDGNSSENNVTYFYTVVQNSKVIPQDFKDNEFVYEIPKYLYVSELSLRNIEQVVRCVETLILFENKELSKNPGLEQVLMVFLSFIYILDNNLLKEITENSINPQKFHDLGNIPNLSFPLSEKIFNEHNITYILALIFDRYNNLNLVNFPSNSTDYLKLESANKEVIELISIYNLDNIKNINALVGGYRSTIYIYDFMDTLIKNLLLFDVI